MWTKLDDGLGSHQKLLRAARLIERPDAYNRALGAFCAALLHANRYLTDGHVPDDAFDAGTPPRTLEALVTVGLFLVDAERGGYQIHDFHQWNPTAEQVRERQARDRDRKRSRQGYKVEPASVPSGGRADSARSPMGFHAESAGIPSETSAGVAVARGTRPGPTRPVQPPPTPPPAEGRRLTRAMRQAALRAQGPPVAGWRERCVHTPTCSTPDACWLKGERGER